ncbi:isoprenylcysteine carboxylmethyltransferase family protein [Chitinilyticum litopenaei]|uniref:Isoprenylcysteine carboxylmethyltransferase family protein n=1 Tax=Chitinilyticum piscinae TaxID=2866724 RepID=A0A8J7K217_9NEIS|nr:isoprenylcysteine carboxylmethyltransferase family protein [Chitinilyticum piscinae]
MHALELKIMPMPLTAVVGLLMWGLATALPGLQIVLPMHGVTALLLALAGLLLVFGSAVFFRRARTTLDPRQPAQADTLITKGLFRISRNPIYLGFLLLLLAWFEYLANLACLPLLPAFVYYLNRFQIIPEERALTARFGAAYQAYCQQVRRWL